MTQIAVVLFEGAEELDYAGPWEVLAAWATQHPDDGVTVYTVAETDGPLPSAKGLRVFADHTWETAPAPDVVLVPGGAGVYPLVDDEAFLSRLTGLAQSGTLVTSVCNGALVLAAAGLLRGRPRPTGWGRLGALPELAPTIDVRPDARFVDSGEVVTAAGVSAGIDMALHLVARLQSVERAREGGRYIQYDPEP